MTRGLREWAALPAVLAAGFIWFGLLWRAARYRSVGELEYNHAGGEAQMAQRIAQLLKER